jgi:hypothetical protein
VVRRPLTTFLPNRELQTRLGKMGIRIDSAGALPLAFLRNPCVHAQKSVTALRTFLAQVDFPL